MVLGLMWAVKIPNLAKQTKWIMKNIGLSLIIFSLIWMFWQTKYFGWNWNPNSIGELFSDGLGLLTAAIGWGMFLSKQNQPKP
ncbi:MAG: hypothetical protein C5B59_08075 [Bacteroidetes bacterium]|nr:MAG: hypothetical protein C5B59_08075 [Bacteroidota bacterium]